MRVFVSRAHRGEDWTDERANQWATTVENFAYLLDQSDGVEVTFDRWHEHDKDLDWTRWGPRQVEDCDWTLIVINEPWAQRWKGTNSPKTGGGAVAEADA